MIRSTGGFMRTTKELLGARIKELRKARRLSQDQLSEKVNIDPKHLSRIEVGKSYPSLATLEKIAKALNVEIKDLFEYMHEVKGKELTENIIRLLKESDEEKLRLILKITRAIVR
jgi:transcriptional regulator with XRE-family HTH domain